MSDGYRGGGVDLGGPEPLDHATWEVSSHAKLPGIALSLVMAAAWIANIPQGGMTGWAVSASALTEGHWPAIFLHIFAHGPLFHLLMNVTALVPLAALLTARLGQPLESWMRFLAIFFGSGLSGALLFLIIHPTSSTPMLGASGAISGLFGLLIRLPSEGPALHAIRSEQVLLGGKVFLKVNLLLILLLTLPAFLLGKSGGVAWESHLGGFLFGLFLGPFLLPANMRT